MESFLASRATVAKPNLSAASPGGGKGAFTPLFAKPPAEPAGTPTTTQPAATEAALGAAEAKPHAHAASVEVVRGADGVVQGIVVNCKCGERIELDCVY